MNKKTVISYGAGAIGKDMVYALSSGYIIYYYNIVLGLSATFIGTILLIARVFDAINDPIMGILVSKTKTRWGRMRPWIFSGTILNAFILYAMFAAPSGLSKSGLMVYMPIIYILWGTTYTIMDIPYWSMIPAITKSGKARENITVVARTCAGIGNAVITIGAIKMVKMLGGGGDDADFRLGFKLLTLIVAIIFIVASVVTCLNVKENIDEEMNTVSVKQMLKALFTNDQAIVVVITIILVNTALYTTSNLITYFFQFDIGGTNWEDFYTLFNTFGGAMQMLAMMLFYPVIRMFLKKRTVFISALASAIFGYVVLLVMAMSGTANVYMLFVPAFFIFSANGILTVMLTVFLSDTVDYGEYKNKHREESVIFSLQTFVVKLASGLAAFFVSVGLDIIKLDKDLAVQTDSTRFGLRFIMSVVPMIGLILAIIIFSKKFFLSEEKVEEISTELKNRRGEGHIDTEN